MRTLILPIALVISLLAGAAATAAPTCETRAGEMVRCATTGAMPVGWSLPSDQRAAASSDDGPSPAQWFVLVSLVGGLFAFIALMPDFDRWDAQSEDSDEQA